MPVSPALLTSIGQAWREEFGRDPKADSAASILPALGRKIWSSWRVTKSDEDLTEELQGLVNASDAALSRAVATAVKLAAGGDQTEAVRKALAAYLRQVPASIRRNFRRPSDPAGKSLPADLQFREPQDLVAFLPCRISVFAAGDRPVPGTEWKLLESLGAGELGEAWLAENSRGPSSERAVLKFFRDQHSAKVLRGEASLLDRIILEARNAGIVALRQAFLELDRPCLVYQYVPGSDLVGLLRDWQRRGKIPSQNQIAQLVRRLAAILAFAHRLERPLVHRNLKPTNILVQQAPGGKISFRIADYGSGAVAVSHAMRSSLRGAAESEAAASSLPGEHTLLYISPQQLQGNEPDPRDDIFALGMIWYQLAYADFTLPRPTEPGWTERLKILGMPEALNELLADCISENPGDRPRNAAEFLERLDSTLTIQPEESSRPTPSVQRDEPFIALPRRLSNELGMTFVLIPPGTFRMGSPASEAERSSDEGPQHEVTLTDPFYLSIYPVTQRQFQFVMGHNPAFFTEARGGGPEFPVESVTWHEANEFCRKLSRLPTEIHSKRSYRLPTEAEWEYACRGGIPMPFSSGLTLSSREANFNGNYPYGMVGRGPYREMTTKVGSFSPNPFGLFDMHGNVWEWCADYYERLYYKNSPSENPAGPAEGELRVVRGGSCFNIGRFCRCAYRFAITPGNRDRDVGMRVVMMLGNGGLA
jgi:formylglycine-generating enzyme required for sulfatase activity